MKHEDILDEIIFICQMKQTATGNVESARFPITALRCKPEGQRPLMTASADTETTWGYSAEDRSKNSNDKGKD
jgi:hypothetical protein